MRKPTVGEQLYLVDIGNNARHGSSEQRECTVTKVGRKYFTVEYQYGSNIDYIREEVITIKRWQEKSDYTSNYEVYETKQAYLEQITLSKWLQIYRQKFNEYNQTNLTLKQLEDAAKILGLELTDK